MQRSTLGKWKLKKKRFYFCKIILHQLIKCYILDMFQLYFTDLIILKNRASVFSAFTFADLTHFTHPSKNLLWNKIIPQKIIKTKYHSCQKLLQIQIFKVKRSDIHSFSCLTLTLWPKNLVLWRVANNFHLKIFQCMNISGDCELCPLWLYDFLTHTESMCKLN